MPQDATNPDGTDAGNLSPDALKELLLEMGGPDQDLPSERQLSSDLNVPRSRLRRVLAELRAKGDLPPAQVGRKSHRRDNSHIDDLVSVANPTDVIELRMILEPQFARLAAIRASGNEIKRIQRHAESRKGEDYGAADLAFHRELAGASRNPLAQELYDLLRQVGTDSRVRLARTGPPCPKRRAERDKEHQQIGQAVADRDPDRAEALMRAHLVNVRRVIENRMQTFTAADPAEMTRQ
ncbi:FadR/GntR family transcriptional regulator [Sedimentitalea nanhaiensis]|uniref:DNA-binding transcriptional regulator, FadR family n=1 Tax=Sedimentitalea nanhaiensis TaxID=999627 RepID=A0A1I7E6Q3_9RHOB|nr:FCD domain-containing protein [Sedimentitalea nanhaiensis]SFU19493.1 DNA-binding transcriptional regulator, FadR family [Sedimentitalea nanhaiensis]